MLYELEFDQLFRASTSSEIISLKESRDRPGYWSFARVPADFGDEPTDGRPLVHRLILAPEETLRVTIMGRGAISRPWTTVRIRVAGFDPGLYIHPFGTSLVHQTVTLGNTSARTVPIEVLVLFDGQPEPIVVREPRGGGHRYAYGLTRLQKVRGDRFWVIIESF